MSVVYSKPGRGTVAVKDRRLTAKDAPAAKNSTAKKNTTAKKEKKDEKKD